MKKNRWGSLSELDRRVRVGSPKYRGLPNRLKHLTAWRAMHKVSPTTNAHASVRMTGTRARTRPSSNLSLRLKEAYVNQHA